MKIGFFDSTEKVSKVNLTELLRNEGLNVLENECLCNYNSIDSDLKYVLIHPHRENVECWKKIKNKVEENPEINCYLIHIIYGDKREEYIGKHANLNVLSGIQNSINMINELIEISKK